MNAAEFIHELKKAGTCKIKGWEFINLLKKDRQLIKKILEKIDKRLVDNLTIKEIGLLL